MDYNTMKRLEQIIEKLDGFKKKVSPEMQALKNSIEKLKADIRFFEERNEIKDKVEILRGIQKIKSRKTIANFLRKS